MQLKYRVYSYEFISVNGLENIDNKKNIFMTALSMIIIKYMYIV